MKNLYFFFLFTIFYNYSTAQVGVNTSDPKATLDLKASDAAAPSATDGLLIPRINAFPAINPTADQDAMLVYLTTTVGSNTPGFYWWNNVSAAWIKLDGNSTGASDVDFYKVGSTTAPDNINDDKYTLGKMALGVTIPTATLDVRSSEARAMKLTVVGNSTAQRTGQSTTITNSADGVDIGEQILINGDGTGDRVGISTDVSGYNGSQITGIQNLLRGNNSIRSVGVSNRLIGNGDYIRTGVRNEVFGDDGSLFGIYNSVNNSLNAVSYGMFNQMTAASTGDQTRTGVENSINSYNTGDAIGTRNSILSYGNGDVIGTDNRIRSIGNTSTGDKTGSYNFITASTGGTHYGVYSNVLKSNSYAGYYLGRLSIGTTTSNNYIMPSSRGTAGQIMQTDGSGNVSWAPASGFSEFTDQGNYLTPVDGAMERVNLGTATTTDGMLNIATTDNKAINIETALTSNGESVTSKLNAIGSSGNTKNLNIVTSSTSNGENVGIYNEILNAGIGTKYGIYNVVNGGSSNSTYGSFNLIDGENSNLVFGESMIIDGINASQQQGLSIDMSDLSTARKTGVNVYLRMPNTSTANSSGIRTEAESTGTGIVHGGKFTATSTAGTAYGVKAGAIATNGGNSYGVHATNPELINGYAGYFLGRVSMGTASNNRYILPLSRGFSGQIMQTDGSGNVSWVSSTSLNGKWTQTADILAPTSGTATKVDIGGNSNPNGTLNINTRHDNAITITTSSGQNKTVINNIIETNPAVGSGNTIGLNNNFTRGGRLWGVYNSFDQTESFEDQRGFTNSFSGIKRNGVFGYTNFFSGEVRANATGNYSIFSNMYGTGSLIGSRVWMRSTITNTADKYGNFIEIDSNIPGTHYGTYSKVLSPTGYAAYLKGNFYTGNDTQPVLYASSVNRRVGIRTDNPLTDVHLKQSNQALAGSGGMRFEVSNSANDWKVMHTGSHFSFIENGTRRAYVQAATGNYITTSDRSLKKNIDKQNNVLDKINNLQLYKYHYLNQSDNDKKNLGVMAQDLIDSFPEIVATNEDGKLGVNYDGLAAIAIQAAKELKEENNELRNLLLNIEERLKKLEEKK